MSSRYYGTNTTVVHCVYCKRAKTTEAHGDLTVERYHELFGGPPDEAIYADGVTYAKAPWGVFCDPVPCRDCKVVKALKVSDVLVAEVSATRNLTGNFVALRGAVMTKILRGEILALALSRGYHAAQPEAWKALTKRGAS